MIRTKGIFAINPSLFAQLFKSWPPEGYGARNHFLSDWREATMGVVVSLNVIVDELEFVTDDISAYLNIKTGEVFRFTSDDFSDAEDDEEDIENYPEWQQEVIIQAREVMGSDDYISLPNKFDIHEYSIIEDFCLSLSDHGKREDLLDIIRGRGAFRRFRDAIIEYGIEDDWFRFRREEYEQIAIRWLESKKIPYRKDDGKTT